MNKKKVLIIGMSPIKGGIETFLINIFRRIDKSTIEFDFLTYCAKCAYEEELIAAGSTVFHITRRGENPFKSYLEHKAFFKKHKDYDFIWIHLSSASNLTPFRLIKKYTNSKIISHSHSTSFESKSGVIHYLHTILNNRNRSKLIELSDYKFACSKEAAQWLFGKTSDVTIIRNGIDVQKFCFNENIRNEIRKSFGIDNETFVIGHAGRMCEAKNHSFLIDLFYGYHKINSNSVLLLAGTGELLESLRNKVNLLNLNDSVIFTGFRDDIYNLYQAFDVFVLPSLFEGFPISALEAQAADLPCLLSSSITESVNITGIVQYIPLDTGVNNWVEKLLELKPADRATHLYNQRVADAGYDMNNTAEYLQSFIADNGNI